MSKAFILLAASIAFLCAPFVNPSATNTITVGRTGDPTTTITIRPTLSQPVKLECQRTERFKDWFTGDPRNKVTPTEGEVSTKSGNYRTLYISSFKPIHATTYSCVVDHYDSTSTVYPVVLANPSETNTLTVGRTGDPTTPITITPTLSQPVWLECQRTDRFKDWFTGDPRSRVSPTEGEISTKSGNDRTLLISSFQSIHATTYSCIVDHYSSTSTVYPVVLKTPIPIPQVQDVTPTNGVKDGSPSLEVSWTTVPGSGITYTVWYSTSSGTKTEPPSGASIVEGITGTSTNLSGLEKGIRYYIWVAAVSPNGQGPYSERVSETTYTVPGAPTKLMISPPLKSCDKLEISWTTPANTGGLPVNYTLYLDEDYNNPLTVSNNVLCIMNNLTANTEYTVTVVAFNELGEGGNVTGTERTRPEAPSISSLSASSSTQLRITLTAPARSSSLIYKCNITEIDMPSITVNGTELEYTVDGLKPNVTYTVKCMSSNGEDSCDSSKDTIGMLCTPAYLISTNSSSLQQVIFTLTTPDGSYECILSTNETSLSNSVGLEHAAIRCDMNNVIKSASSNGGDFCDPCNTTMPSDP